MEPRWGSEMLAVNVTETNGVRLRERLASPKVSAIRAVMTGSTWGNLRTNTRAAERGLSERLNIGERRYEIKPERGSGSIKVRQGRIRRSQHWIWNCLGFIEEKEQVRYLRRGDMVRVSGKKCNFYASVGSEAPGYQRPPDEQVACKVPDGLWAWFERYSGVRGSVQNRIQCGFTWVKNLLC